MKGRVVAYREIGDPVLKEVCKEVDITKPSMELKSLIADLKSTFEYNAPKCLGIAAPQLGYNLRVLIVGAKKEEVVYSSEKDIPLTIMINPEITYYSKEKIEDYEGCCSVPNIRGIVSRSKRIKIKFLNEKFKEEIWEEEKFAARLIQHEYDHLDGICFTQRVKDNASFVTADNLKKFIKKPTL